MPVSLTFHSALGNLKQNPPPLYISLQDKILVSPRYDYVTLIPIVLQLGLRIGPIQHMGAN
jgi:hypothetical protein